MSTDLRAELTALLHDRQTWVNSYNELRRRAKALAAGGITNVSGVLAARQLAADVARDWRAWETGAVPREARLRQALKNDVPEPEPESGVES